MTGRVVGHIVFDPHVVGGVDNNTSLVRLPNRVSGNSGADNVVAEMKMNGILAEQALSKSLGIGKRALIRMLTTYLLTKLTDLDPVNGLNDRGSIEEPHMAAIVKVGTTLEYNVARQ